MKDKSIAESVIERLEKTGEVQVTPDDIHEAMYVSNGDPELCEDYVEETAEYASEFNWAVALTPDDTEDWEWEELLMILGLEPENNCKRIVKFTRADQPVCLYVAFRDDWEAI